MASTVIPMTEQLDMRSLLRLQTWLSPSFPTGSFAYSQGLETAVRDTIVFDEGSLRDWLVALLSGGMLRNEGILLSEAWRRYAEASELDEIADLAVAMITSGERLTETMDQGRAFIKAAEPWLSESPHELSNERPLPIAVGAISGLLDIPLEATLSAYLQAFINNQAQAAIRLSILGQEGATRLAARLENRVLYLVDDLLFASIDDLGSLAFQADIMAMRHEDQEVRLFRS